MTIQSEIDGALRRLGSVEPPSGFEQRIHRELRNAPRRLSKPISISISMLYVVSGGALAACVVVSAVAFNPALHKLMYPQSTPIQNQGAAVSPRVGGSPSGGFGAASVVHVPVQPVPVQPTPINQGRGRSRSGRGTLPTGSPTPLPRGVAPGQPLAPTGTGDR